MNKWHDQAYWLYEQGYISYDRVEEIAKKLEEEETINSNVGHDVGASTHSKPKTNKNGGSAL